MRKMMNMMKRLTPIVLTALLIAGCSSGDGDTTPEPSSVTPTVTQAPEPSSEPTGTLTASSWGDLAQDLRVLIATDIVPIDREDCTLGYTIDSCRPLWDTADETVRMAHSTWRATPDFVPSDEAAKHQAVTDGFDAIQALADERDEVCGDSESLAECTTASLEWFIAVSDLMEPLGAW